MLYLSAGDIRAVFSMRDAIDADKRAFVLQSRGACEVPLRTNFDVEMGGGQSLFMPAHVRGTNGTGIKIVSVFASNAALGKPVVPATMVLLDDNTGEVEAIIDGTELTCIRTGAISGAATEVLAREDASVGALFGTGGQAGRQLEAIMEARSLTEVRVFDIAEERVAAFIAENRSVAERYGTRLVASRSADEAIDGAEVITTVTTSPRPVFDGDRVAPGAHVNGIGAYTPRMAELDPELLVRADKVFVDNKTAVLAEAGDLIQPMNAGRFGEERISGELGAVIAGEMVGRSTASEITVCKSVGFAGLDVVAAREIVERAKRAGIGTTIAA